MTSRELASKAIRFDNPPRLPLVFINADLEYGDIIITDVETHFGGPMKIRSEWGFEWDKRDETMGMVIDQILKDGDDVYSFKAPDPGDPGRFETFHQHREKYGKDKYHIASLGLSGFTIMILLRGFEEALIDLYTERERCDYLADEIFSFEEDVIRRAAAEGSDGIALFDDWGSQDSLIIDPAMWRDYFKPRYKRQIGIAHENGLTVYFHSCGYIYEIIPDLIEIGVDMLNVSQPNLYDIEKLGRDFGGKVCFVCPVSYQTTSISGTRQEIFGVVRELVDNLGSFNGGLIGYIEKYPSIGMSEENYRACIEAFQTLGA